MARHVGIVACSAEGAALCYRTLCAEAPVLMGKHRHPEVSMHTHPLADYMVHIRSGDWGKVAELMLSSAGAEFAICPDNTIHQAYEIVVGKTPIPWLHIADEVVREAAAQGFKNLAITGTKYLMAGPVYPRSAEKSGIACRVPDEPDRERINTIIFDELVNGIVKDESRRYFYEVIGKLKDGGCDAVVLGCTELPLLADTSDCPLPALDSTRLLARAAIRESLK